MEAASFSE